MFATSLAFAACPASPDRGGDAFVGNLPARPTVMTENTRQRTDEAMQARIAALERQVSERTAELALYRNIVEGAAFPICAYDSRQRVVFFNKAHEESWSRATGRCTRIGEALTESLPSGQAETQRGFARRAIRGEAFTVETSFGAPAPGYGRGFGEETPHWEVNYAPLRNEAGMIVGAFHHARDVTARLQVEAELAHAEAALHQAQKMESVGQLTGGLAHDFNNLLTGIIGCLEMLQNRLESGRVEDIDRLVDAAQDAARRAASLTHRLLAFSRRQTLDPRAMDVVELVRGMEDLVRRTAGPAITVSTIADGTVWPVLVDPGQLENALLNLCINARDAMPDGGTITIEAANRTLDGQAARDNTLAPGDYVGLSVSDTGSGMSREVMEKAFEPFFTTKPIGVGTGLGLSMIRGFVQQSGGNARILSGRGGTVVRLLLPRHVGEAAQASPSQRSGEAHRAATGQTVLVVDDEATIRMLVVETLEELGYRAIEASDGNAALRVMRTADPVDLLVTDVGLRGGMNGRQLADAARELYPDLKVLFITGYAENAVLNRGDLDARMQVLVKPFTLKAIAARVGDVVAGEENGGLAQATSIED